MTEVFATCHCGDVRIALSQAPTHITHCNCSLCRRYGALWTYYPVLEVTITAKAGTSTYAWNGKNVDFHHCMTCGCLTHWSPRNPTRDRMGVNARLLEQPLLAAAEWVYKDAAGTGLFH